MHGETSRFAEILIFIQLVADVLGVEELVTLNLSEIISVHHAGNNIRWDQSKTQLSVLFYLSRCFSRRLRTAIWRRWISVDTSAFC